MNKLETMQNRVYGLMRFGSLSEDFWKAYVDYQNYLKEMNILFVYRDTDAIYVKKGNNNDTE